MKTIREVVQEEIENGKPELEAKIDGIIMSQDLLVLMVAVMVSSLPAKEIDLLKRAMKEFLGVDLDEVHMFS